MKVVHVVRTDNFAGVERYVSVLAASQAERGYEVTIVGGKQDAIRAALGEASVESTAAGSIPHAVRLLSDHRGADLFNVHMTEAEGAALLAPLTWHVPVVATRHFGAIRGKTRLGQLARPLIHKRIAAQIAVSQYVARHIDGVSSVVYPGVASRPDVDAGTRERTILMAQRLESEKQSEVGLAAFAQSGLADEGWSLQIAGNGSLRPMLEARAHALGLGESVSFLGFVTDMDAALARCGLLLATPPSEHFGLSVLEAMSWGTPVVAAAAAGHLETAGSASDLGLFDPGDAADAARVLRRLALSDAERADYGRALRDTQRSRFTLEAQADGVERVYRKVLS